MLICRNRHFKKKRLRKKYYQKEFQEIALIIKANIPNSNIQLHDEFIDVIEKLNLMCGGSFYKDDVFLHICKDKGSVTESDKKVITDFVESKSGTVLNAKFVDAWYDDEDDD
jgi:uncharacterized protein YggL (DUF469 family)